MEDQFIPDDVIADRFARLNEVLGRAGLRKNQERVGRREEVLVEGPSRREPTRVSGRTRQGKLIHFTPPSEGLRPGALALVDVTYGAPFHLLGDYVETVRGPRHKTRLPLASS